MNLLLSLIELTVKEEEVKGWGSVWFSYCSWWRSDEATRREERGEGGVKEGNKRKLERTKTELERTKTEREAMEGSDQEK